MERTPALVAALVLLVGALAYKLAFDIGARLATSNMRFTGSGH